VIVPTWKFTLTGYVDADSVDEAHAVRPHFRYRTG
jgi:hypothetical protein